jgi:hypothetical protein
MRQHRFTAQDYSPEATIPDAVIDPADPAFQIANGVVPKMNVMDMPVWTTPAQNKAQLMKDNNIKPGTEEWFKLWFNRS